MQAVCLLDGNLLTLGIYHKYGLREGLHLTHAAEVALKLLKLLGEHSLLLLYERVHTTVLNHGLELLHALDTGAHGDEVGEHAAQPALVDIGHASTLGLGLDGLLRLLLGADEKNGTTLGSDVAQRGIGAVAVDDGLLEIENVDAIALTKDVGTHLGVPTTRLVTVVAPGIKQRVDVDLYSHGIPPVVGPPREVILPYPPVDWLSCGHHGREVVTRVK